MLEQLIATQLVGKPTMGILWNQKMIMDTTLRQMSPLHNLEGLVYYYLHFVFVCVCVFEIPYIIFCHPPFFV